MHSNPCYNVSISGILSRSGTAIQVADKIVQCNRAFSKLQVGQSKTSFEKNCFSAWASTLNMGLINKVDMVCLSPVGYSV